MWDGFNLLATIMLHVALSILSDAICRGNVSRRALQIERETGPKPRSTYYEVPRTVEIGHRSVIIRP